MTEAVRNDTEFGCNACITIVGFRRNLVFSFFQGRGGFSNDGSPTMISQRPAPTTQNLRILKPLAGRGFKFPEGQQFKTLER